MEITSGGSWFGRHVKELRAAGEVRWCGHCYMVVPTCEAYWAMQLNVCIPSMQVILWHKSYTHYRDETKDQNHTYNPNAITVLTIFKCHTIALRYRPKSLLTSFPSISHGDPFHDSPHLMADILEKPSVLWLFSHTTWFHTIPPSFLFPFTFSFPE